MSFLSRLFKKEKKTSESPKIRFGRYSDTYKSAEQYEAWDKALVAFEDERYLDSYQHFFEYLRDEDEDNVQFERTTEGISFKIYQGSKMVTGFANQLKFKAEARIAKAASLDSPTLLAQLVGNNYDLKFSRYALDAEQNIVIVFNTYALDGSPYKLYHSLKELATHADKQDDLLLEKYEGLSAIDDSHSLAIADQEKEVKYDFIQYILTRTLDSIQSSDLDPDQYPGAMAYVYLDVCYKLDYLVHPEGNTMETLERVHRLYFSKEKGIDAIARNKQLHQEFTNILNRPKSSFFNEFYTVRSTFGITTAVNHDKVAAFIESELRNMDWYAENGYEHVALAIPGYIVGYCLFHFAVPLPDRAFLQLYYEIMNNGYFRRLGYPNLRKAGVFQRRNIKKAIQKIVANNKEHFPKLNPATGSLDFSSKTAFAKSYLKMVEGLNMTSID